MGFRLDGEDYAPLEGEELKKDQQMLKGFRCSEGGDCGEELSLDNDRHEMKTLENRGINPPPARELRIEPDYIGTPPQRMRRRSREEI